jgi:pyrroline-5-carboxylate reductase
MPQRKGTKKTSLSPSILLVGCGRMGSALLKGWIANGLGPVAVVETAPSPSLRRFAKANGVAIHKDVMVVDTRALKVCVAALKPQILKTEAVKLARIAQSGTLMLSIAAGTSTATLYKAWGSQARIIRAMPNTPGAIGRGISALYAGRNAKPADHKFAQKLLAALGETLWVYHEDLIDIVTVVSGSGPAYVFLLTEALAAAAEAEGMPRPLAEKLARATIIGSGALLDADPRAPAELRRDVTSPHGTTEAALEILMAENGLAQLLVRAVAAARARAVALRA